MRATVTGDARVLEGAEGVHNLRLDGGTVAFDVDNTRMGAVMGTLTGLGILSLVSNPPSLEELFLRHYGDELAARGADRNGGTAV